MKETLVTIIGEIQSEIIKNRITVMYTHLTTLHAVIQYFG